MFVKGVILNVSAIIKIDSYAFKAPITKLTIAQAIRVTINPIIA